MRRLWLLLGGVFLALAPWLPVGAQTPAPDGGQAVLTAIDASRFPAIDVYLAVENSAGQHLAGLPAEAFTLTENQSPVARPALMEAEIGVQVVFVVDVGPAFKTRDANGVNRFEYVKQALTDFIHTGLRPVDDVTVLTSEGLLIAHVSAGAPVLDALNRYTPVFQTAADPYALLNSGLNYAADVPPRPGMRRMLVVLTNGLPAAPATALTDVLARAQAAQTQVHTVFVGPNGAQGTTGAQILSQLAQTSGGLALFLQDPASLQPIFDLLTEQRPQYRISYRSAINLTGQHTAAAQVALPSGEILQTPAASFQLRVEPPLITLTEPPARLAAAESGPDYPLGVQITFPDGHARNLRSVQLLVDDTQLDIPLESDLTTVGWPLAGYTASLTHTLQLRVMDELGLAADSERVAVFVEVPAAPTTVAATPPAEASVLPWVGWAVAGAALSLTVGGGGLWYWRRRAAGLPGLAFTWPVRAPAPAPPDPIRPQPTKPLTPAPAVSRRVRLPQLHFAARRSGRPAHGPAYLEVVEAGAGKLASSTIELTNVELRLGRDHQMAEVVFPDRSVSRLHARLTETAPGVFTIFDAGSTSGTWVNFNPVPAEAGQALQPGDLINLGRVQLRFHLRAAASPNTPPPE
ncbi:MAG: FHA domain-containing protein [Anaerolineales bacterium]|nr:FHA domain-containing protein [Anaerolineales bacterium]